MKKIRFSIRQKIAFSLMSVMTIVVCLVVFTMARFFHDDKRAYLNDWVSIVSVSTAEECDALLLAYKQRLQIYADVLSSEALSFDEKRDLLQRFFNELPELVALTLFVEGEEVRRADNSNAMAQAALTVDDLRGHYSDGALPLQRILDGEVHVANSTLVPELPAFTLSFASESEDNGAPPTVISAYLDSTELLGLGARFKMFHVEIADSDGRVLAHRDREHVVQRAAAELSANARTVHRADRAGVTSEFVDRDGRGMIGGFAPVSVGGATVAVAVPQSAAYLASRELLRRLVVVALALLVCAGLGGLFWAYRITRPMQRLSDATRVIGRGDFEVQVRTESNDEIGDLARSFNQMATELRVREARLHETTKQLVQSEKLAVFGELGAGIAHEVKNPLAGILGCAQLSLLELDDKRALQENLELIEKETGRCKEIIENLLRFARQEKAEMNPTDVNQVVHDSVRIVSHQLAMHEVKLVEDLSPQTPTISGNANQLQQVLMNLMMNAQQAMNGNPGTVTVSTLVQDGGSVEIRVQDNGSGMPEEVRRKIFEPFFSTKPTGEGTGLGLSVSFGIIKDHGGEVRVESEVGSGTTFFIQLPIAAPVADGVDQTEMSPEPVAT